MLAQLSHGRIMKLYCWFQLCSLLSFPIFRAHNLCAPEVKRLLTLIQPLELAKNRPLTVLTISANNTTTTCQFEGVDVCQKKSLSSSMHTPSLPRTSAFLLSPISSFGRALDVKHSALLATSINAHGKTPNGSPTELQRSTNTNSLLLFFTSYTV